jgi:hypothetical protein
VILTTSAKLLSLSALALKSMCQFRTTNNRSNIELVLDDRLAQLVTNMIVAAMQVLPNTLGRIASLFCCAFCKLSLLHNVPPRDINSVAVPVNVVFINTGLVAK